MKNLNYKTSSPEEAVAWLSRGQILAYPSESVWGLGCDAFDEQAVSKLLALKQRPNEKGLIVLCAKLEVIAPFLQNLPNGEQDKILISWQGANKQATTWLFEIPSQLYIPNWIKGKHKSLGIRLINHPAIAKLCTLLVSDKNPYGFLVSTSCNRTNQAPARDFHTAFNYFGNEVAYFVGETLGYDKPSQIKDAKTGELIRA